MWGCRKSILLKSQKVAILGANQIEQSREQLNFGLEKCIIEVSPDFDESPAGQPPAKKTWWRKMVTKKEQEHIVKEVRAFSLHELTTLCLDVTRFKLMERVNPLVKEFAMAFKLSDIYSRSSQHHHACQAFDSSITNMQGTTTDESFQCVVHSSVR